MELQSSTSKAYFLAVEKIFVSLGLLLKENSSIACLVTDRTANLVDEISDVFARLKNISHKLRLS